MTADAQQREIAESLAAGVERNFERLVTAYQDRVFAFALNLAGDRHAAEEIAQETFVAAYRALCGYDEARRAGLSLRSWLYAIALNLVRNRARSAKVRRLVPLEEAAGDATPLPAQAAIRAEERQALRAALVALPLKFRRPIVLRHVEGYSYAAIAQLLSVPVGTVKADVHRGLARLRQDARLRSLR